MLSQQITMLRKQAKMSQAQLAKKLYIGPSAVGMYEQGRRTPSIDILRQMAKVFEVSLDYLVTGRESSYTREEEPCLCPRCPYRERYGCGEHKE